MVATSGTIVSATHAQMNVIRPEVIDALLKTEMTVSSVFLKAGASSQTLIMAMALHPHTRPHCLTRDEILSRETPQEDARLLAMMNFIEADFHQGTTTGLPETMEAVEENMTQGTLWPIAVGLEIVLIRTIVRLQEAGTKMLPLLSIRQGKER